MPRFSFVGVVRTSVVLAMAGCVSVFPNGAGGAPALAQATVSDQRVLGADYSSQVLADSPIAYWRLNEPTGTGGTAIDQMGSFNGGYFKDHERRASLVGDPTDGSQYLNRTGSRSTSPYITMGDVLDDTNEFTLEAWVNIESMAASGVVHAIANKNHINAPRNGFVLYVTPDRVHFDIFNAGVQRNVTTAANPPPGQPPFAPALGVLYHIVSSVAYEGSNTVMRIWVNGVIRGERLFTGLVGAGDSNTSFSVGRWEDNGPDSTPQTYDGIVDEVAVYNTALTQPQIQAHYAAGLGVPVTPNPTLLDDFNRSPESPVSQSGNWATVGIKGGLGARLSQNKLRQFPSPSGGYSYRASPYLGGNMEAAATITTRPNTGHDLSVFICIQDAGSASWDGYELRARVLSGPDSWEIRRVDNGAGTVLASTTFESTAGGSMLLRRVGATLQFWWRPAGGSWSQQLAASDAAYQWGVIGAGGYDSGALDDFRGGSLLTLLDQYAPELRYDALDTFRADSAAMMTGNYQPTYSNTLFAPPVGILAQADPSLPEDNLSLDYLGAFYPPGGIAQGRASTVDDYINAENNYAADAQRMQVLPGRAYGRAVAEPGGRTTLQYWFFYYFNWHPELTNIGDHEGDWEMVQVELDSFGSPSRAAYSQHGGGETCVWSEVNKTATGRPLVYVARGSHASYFRSGTKLPSSTAPVGDYVGDDAAPQTPTIFEIDPPAPGWLDWAGRWGASTSGDFQSPYGPARPSSKWLTPATWADGQSSCWEGGSGRLSDTQSPSAALSKPKVAATNVGLPTAPPKPKVIATKVGKRVRIGYSFSVWPTEAGRRVVLLVTSVQSSSPRYSPFMKRHRISSREGVLWQPLGLGTGPFKLYAAAYSQDGRSSATVSVRVRQG